MLLIYFFAMQFMLLIMNYIVIMLYFDNVHTILIYYHWFADYKDHLAVVISDIVAVSVINFVFIVCVCIWLK